MLIGNVGRWHGSLGTATPDVLEREIANESRAIARLQGIIAEHLKLLDAHRKQRRNLQRRLKRRTVKS